MSFRDWESDVEFYDSLPQGLVRRIDKRFVETPLDSVTIVETRLWYPANRDRIVRMRVMGFSALCPVVKTEITDGSDGVRRRSGVLIGCIHPEDKELIEGVVRTHHFPVLRMPVDGSLQLLPTPISQLRSVAPRL